MTTPALRLPTPRRAAEPERRRLRKELGLLEVVTITVGSMIGSGIFVVPALVAAAFPDPWVMAGLWLAGGIVTLAGALALAELVTLFPTSGGPYVFAREAFGTLPGVMAGWSMLLGKLFVGPAVALIFARYMSFLFPLSPRGVVLMAAWALVAVTFVNWMGVRHGAAVQNVFTFGKVAALVFVVGVGFLLSDPAAVPAAPDLPTVAASAALVGISFAYNSWYNPTFVAEEVRRPDRDLPLGLAIGVGIVTLLYVAASTAYWLLLGPGMAASPLVASDAAATVLSWGGLLVAWGVLVSTFGNVNGGSLVTARLGLAMSRDGFLPGLHRINRHGVPGVAMVTFAAVQIGLLLLLDFQGLAAFGTFTTSLFLAVVVAGVYWMRHRHPDLPRPYRAWGYPVTPAIFLAGTTAFLVLLALQDPAAVGIGLLVIALAVPLWLWGRRRGPVP